MDSTLPRGCWRTGTRWSDWTISLWYLIGMELIDGVGVRTKRFSVNSINKYKSMASKGYRRFKNRLEYFRTDAEVAEIIVQNRELLKGDDVIFNKVNVENYPLLSRRTNSTNSRKLVVTHLRKTIYVAFVKDMYEEVTEYLRYVLREGAMNGVDANRLVGEHNVNMKANELLSKGTRRDMIQTIIEQIFQQLERERSTMELISKLMNKLGLSIDKLANMLKITPFELIQIETNHRLQTKHEEYLLKSIQNK